MRTLLRKLILWALAGGPEPKHDPADLDKIAAQTPRT